jgi:cbb3-type cytochrome oxidase subunit 3
VFKRWSLSALLGIIGLINLVRAGISLKMIPILSKLNLAFFPLLGGMYAAFGIFFIGLAVICFRRNRHCPAFFFALGYEFILWTIHIMAFRSTYARSLWMRDAIISIIFLGIVFFLSRTLPPRRQSNNHIRRT